MLSTDNSMYFVPLMYCIYYTHDSIFKSYMCVCLCVELLFLKITLWYLLIILMFIKCDMWKLNTIFYKKQTRYFIINVRIFNVTSTCLY